MPRFDIRAVVGLEKRAKGTGGVLFNGFADGEVVYRRPGLLLGEAAPFSGTALGLVQVGNSLYSILSSSGSTAPQSWKITLSFGGTSVVTSVVPTVGHPAL
jgi:hypothetical protein